MCRPAAYVAAPHKQLHIWAGRDASGEQRGGRGSTAQRVNERGPEGDGSRQAPVVLLAPFRRRLKFPFGLVALSSVNFFFLLSFFCSSSSSQLFSAFADCFKKEYNMYQRGTADKNVLGDNHSVEMLCRTSRKCIFLHRSPLPHQFECFHVHSVFSLYVFMSISVSMCRPTGLSCTGTLAILCFFLVHTCVFVHVCSEGHLISGLAARHACLQVVCLHLGAEQI